MTIESASYLNDLNSSYPANGDQMGEGDDHIRQLKAVLKATFPGRAGADGRAIIKSANFTPAATENGCLFLTLAQLTCTLPALAGVADGTIYMFKPLNSSITIATYSGTEYLDSGSTSKTIEVEGWAIVIKVDATRWAIFNAAALTALAITTALGATYVQNASYATIAGNATYHMARTDNPHSVTKSQVGLGNCDNTADANKSVNYANSAGNADTVDGYHYDNLPYASKDPGLTDVGSVIFAVNAAGAATPGATTHGAFLRYANSDIYTEGSGGAPGVGTWRCRGVVSSWTQATVWQRIS
jgi:hypothetical protein